MSKTAGIVIIGNEVLSGKTHDIKGQGIYAYVTLMNGVQPSDELRGELPSAPPTSVIIEPPPPPRTPDTSTPEGRLENAIQSAL